MAVYTHLGAEDLAGLIAEYEVGQLVSAKGIAEGVSNSNWLVETTAGRFILTMYEHRVEAGDLPFFLGLLDHLSAKGSPVPRTIHDRAGAAFRLIDGPGSEPGTGKPVALIEFLPGVSIDTPRPAQARAVGEALAGIHIAADGAFRPTVSEALIAGYHARRHLPTEASAALPVLARGACMRFLSSRAYDWLHTPAGALVTRKDPLVFARRLSFYEAEGENVFRPLAA